MLRFRYFQPLDPSKTRGGSSLLELVLCIAILGIVLISFLRVRDQFEDSKIASVARTVRRINEIATTICATTGAWPADVNNSILPVEMKPFLANDIFKNDTPMGGRWDWNGPANNVSNSIGIALRFDPASSANTQGLSKLDALIDDGDLNTGDARGVIKFGRYFYVVEVAIN
ncbi:MAG: type II secretion system protein [Planctomycetota bacterium]|jgi:hypothetical protein